MQGGNKSTSFRLMRISRQAWHDAKEKMSKEELSNMQYHICMAILESPSISQDGISKQLFMDKSSVAKLVAKLVEQGYVKREVNPNDHREYRLFLTEKGVEVTKDLATALQQWEIRVFGETESEQYKELDLRLKEMEKKLF